MIKVLDPVGRTTAVASKLAPRLDTLDGKRLGFLANGKPNAANLLRVAAEHLQEKFDIREIVFLDKHEAGLTANDTVPDFMLQQLMACDAVLHASGD